MKNTTTNLHRALGITRIEMPLTGEPLHIPTMHVHTLIAALAEAQADHLTYRDGWDNVLAMREYINNGTYTHITLRVVDAYELVLLPNADSDEPARIPNRIALQCEYTAVEDRVAEFMAEPCLSDTIDLMITFHSVYSLVQSIITAMGEHRGISKGVSISIDATAVQQDHIAMFLSNAAAQIPNAEFIRNPTLESSNV